MTRQGGLDLEMLEGLMNRDVFYPLSELETRALIDRVRELEAFGRRMSDYSLELQSRLTSLLRVREAAVEWKAAKEWASHNPSLMLSSHLTTAEAAEIMRKYFDKETALLDAIAALADSEEGK